MIVQYTKGCFAAVKNAYYSNAGECMSNNIEWKREQSGAFIIAMTM